MSGIPKFPRFGTVSPRLMNQYRAAISSYPCFTEFNFVDLWAWNADSPAAVSLLDGAIVLRRGDYSSRDTQITLLGRGDLRAVIDIVLDHDEASSGNTIRPVPVAILRETDLEGLEVVEDPGSTDYILDLRQQSELNGRKFSRQRNRIRRFSSETASGIDARLVDCESPRVRQGIEELFCEWAVAKGQAHDSGAEWEALERTLALGVPDLHIFALYRGERMLSFMVNEVVANDQILGHFFKSSRRYVGLREYAVWRYADQFRRKGFTYLNIQMDLGIPELRRSKLELRPAMCHAKVSIGRT